MKTYDDMTAMEWREMLDRISKLTGIMVENTGGGVMCFIHPIDEYRELIFGYASGPLGVTLWNHSTGKDEYTAEMEHDHATAQEQATFITNTIKTKGK